MPPACSAQFLSGACSLTATAPTTVLSTAIRNLLRARVADAKSAATVPNTPSTPGSAYEPGPSPLSPQMRMRSASSASLRRGYRPTPSIPPSPCPSKPYDSPAGTPEGHSPIHGSRIHHRHDSLRPDGPPSPPEEDVEQEVLWDDDDLIARTPLSPEDLPEPGRRVEIWALGEKKRDKKGNLFLTKVHVFVEEAEVSTARGWIRRAMDVAYPLTKPYRRVLLLVNPVGGRGKGRQIVQNVALPIFEAAGCTVDLVEHHARDMPLIYDVIASASGDGNVHEIINGMSQRPDAKRALQIPIAMIPVGSGCALNVNILGADDTFNIQLSCLNAIKGEHFPLDLLSLFILPSMERRLSYLSFGLGLIVDADLGTEHIRWMGDARFLFGFIQGLAKNKSAKVRISMDVISDDKLAMVHTARQYARRIAAGASANVLSLNLSTTNSSATPSLSARSQSTKTYSIPPSISEGSVPTRGRPKATSSAGESLRPPSISVSSPASTYSNTSSSPNTSSVGGFPYTPPVPVPGSASSPFVHPGPFPLPGPLPGRPHVYVGTPPVPSKGCLNGHPPNGLPNGFSSGHHSAPLPSDPPGSYANGHSGGNPNSHNGYRNGYPRRPINHLNSHHSHGSGSVPPTPGHGGYVHGPESSGLSCPLPIRSSFGASYGEKYSGSGFSHINGSTHERSPLSRSFGDRCSFGALASPEKNPFSHSYNEKSVLSHHFESSHRNKFGHHPHNDRYGLQDTTHQAPYGKENIGRGMPVMNNGYHTPAQSHATLTGVPERTTSLGRAQGTCEKASVMSIFSESTFDEDDIDFADYEEDDGPLASPVALEPDSSWIVLDTTNNRGAIGAADTPGPGWHDGYGVLYMYAGMLPWLIRDVNQFPVALPGTGACDMIVQRLVPRMEMLQSMSGAQDGDTFWNEGQHYWRVRRFIVENLDLEHQPQVAIDGEGTPFDTFHVEVLPRAATVCAIDGRLAIGKFLTGDHLSKPK